MKLTNTIRDAFVRAALSDVPHVDYQAKTIKVVTDDAIQQLPPKVRAIYKDKELSHFIRHTNGYFGCAYVSIPNGGSSSEFKLSQEAAAKVQDFKIADDAQNAQRKRLRDQLHAVAYSVSTRKALVDALPEFEKYLPADEAAACKTLPAIANVVSSFVAAGWPKDQKPLKKAA